MLIRQRGADDSGPKPARKRLADRTAVPTASTSKVILRILLRALKTEYGSRFSCTFSSGVTNCAGCGSRRGGCFLSSKIRRSRISADLGADAGCTGEQRLSIL